MKALWFVVWLGGIIALDYFVDYPDWTYLPEVWICPGSSNGFQFCS